MIAEAEAVPAITEPVGTPACAPEAVTLDAEPTSAAASAAEAVSADSSAPDEPGVATAEVTEEPAATAALPTNARPLLLWSAYYTQVCPCFTCSL